MLDRGTRLLLDGQVRLLLAWNAVVNLTAIREPGSVARLHVADSLAALPFLAGVPHATILDIGSGGGFPGLPLAIALPASRVTLTESVGKKARFLRTAIEALGLVGRASAVDSRVEGLAPGRWDVVTARAVGGLAELVELAMPLLGPGGHLLAWKRGDLGAEMAAGGHAAAALGGSVPRWWPYPKPLATAAGLEGHGLVVVRKVAATPSGFPRDPAVRSRRPW